MQVDPRIFREYDVRGIAGTKFDAKTVEEYEKWYGKFTGVSIDLPVAEAIGKAYGTMIAKAGGKKVVVGYEKRPYAEELTEAFIKGVLSTGVDVDYAGISLTPLVYFATAYYDYDGGVNITGSHNVYFFNGFKMMKKDVYPLFGEELQQLKQIIEKDAYLVAEVVGKQADKVIYEDFKKYVLERIKLKRKLKVVIDCGNGSAGVFVPDILEALGCEVIGLYIEPDATFPNHVPDPEMEQNMADLMKTVVKEKADIGIGYDADGDRTGFVDEKGEMVDADNVLLLLAKDVLGRNPNKKVMFDVKCTELMMELLPGMKGIPLMHRTGHAPFKETLRQDKEIILGGEVSGHFYIVEDYFKIDDGVFASILILRLLAQAEGKFSDLFADIPVRVRTPEIKLPCEDEKKFALVTEIVNDLKDKYRSILVDGIRFYINAKTWALLRPSNTSPYLTVRIESDNEADLLKIKNILADELEKYPAVLDKLNRKEVATQTGKLGWV